MRNPTDSPPATVVAATDSRWTRSLLIGAIFLVFLASAAGVLDLAPGIGPHLTLRPELLTGVAAPAGTADRVRSADLLTLVGVGAVLSFVLPLTAPIPACLLTLAVAAAVFLEKLALPGTADFVPLEFMLLTILALFVVNVVASWIAENRARRSIVAAFGQYVPPAVVDTLSRHPERFDLEGEARELSVLFCDIRNFSSFSEGLEPRELARLLNRYFTVLSDVLYLHGATIDKYIGDAIMAFWGAPIPQEDHAERALAAAIQMQESLVGLREEFAARGWPRIEVGIGINTGIMNVGNMGSRYRIAYTVIGDAVNLGARIEQLTRGYDADIIVSDTTRGAVPEFLYRELDYVRVRGKFRPTRLYEPICPALGADPGIVHALELHERAITAYYRRDWAVARAGFQWLAAEGPLDRSYYAVILKRIARYEVDPPPAGWDGVSALDAG
ncbi:MAG: adenylate/guanylate cyclase domain-containing protein [Gammaproteobacteria bacterium]